MQGTKARVYITALTHVVAGERISLVKGKDRAGNIELPVYEFSFAGRTVFDVPARNDKPPRVSDDLEIALTPGLWYLQESASEKVKIPYFFDVDGGFRAKTSDAPGVHGHQWRGGLVYRIDVLTTDRRPGVVCMGDSITQGYWLYAECRTSLSRHFRKADRPSRSQYGRQWRSACRTWASDRFH